MTVTDLESTNGTYIDKEELMPMQAQALNVGSNVIFGEICSPPPPLTVPNVGDEHLASFVLDDEPVEDIVVVEKQDTEK